MNQKRENITVLTLDAGGTNFVFSAISNAKEIVKPVALPSNAHDLELCLKTIVNGFELVKKQLQVNPEAISFAFPGPADYINGVIGDLGNLPAFRGGVALGPMLEEHFQIPAYINNDGDLFAYGEAMFGLLPKLNQQLQNLGTKKQFHNLIGITLGTGFGGGLVRNNEIWLGDNGAAGEVWLLRSAADNGLFAEENISARAVISAYKNEGGEIHNGISPQDIYHIATGKAKGNQKAAIESFTKLGNALGLAMAEVITLIDGLVVIGGGLANAAHLFFPEMLKQLNGSYNITNGNPVKRLESQVINLDDVNMLSEFVKSNNSLVKLPFSDTYVNYNPTKWVGVGTSVLGTSKAIALGAYAFALNKI
ncbi:MAG: ROK family protein [Bacteroidales bacterium]|nr:ROK family protein [Bacteroidales bacterium]